MRHHRIGLAVLQSCVKKAGLLDTYPVKRYSVKEDGYDVKVLASCVARLASRWGKLIPADYFCAGPLDEDGYAEPLATLSKDLDAAHRGVTKGGLGKGGKAVVKFSVHDICDVMGSSVVGWWRLYHQHEPLGAGKSKKGKSVPHGAGKTKNGKNDKTQKARAVLVQMLDVLGQEKYNRRHDLALPLVWDLRRELLEHIQLHDEDFCFHDGFQEQPSSPLDLPIQRAEDGRDVQMLCNADRTLQENNRIMNGIIDSVVKLVELDPTGDRNGVDALPSHVDAALCELIEVGSSSGVHKVE